MVKPVIKTEEPEIKTAPVASTVPVITSSKTQTATTSEPMPLNVSIRLPEDLNERKNLIKRYLPFQTCF